MLPSDDIFEHRWAYLVFTSCFKVPCSRSQFFARSVLDWKCIKFPIWRGPLYDINRYNRIVRQGPIENTTKGRFYWLNQRYFLREERLYREKTTPKKGQHKSNYPPTTIGGTDHNGCIDSKWWQTEKVPSPLDWQDWKISRLQSSLQTLNHVTGRDFENIENKPTKENSFLAEWAFWPSEKLKASQFTEVGTEEASYNVLVSIQRAPRPNGASF